MLWETGGGGMLLGRMTLLRWFIIWWTQCSPLQR